MAKLKNYELCAKETIARKIAWEIRDRYHEEYYTLMEFLLADALQANWAHEFTREQWWAMAVALNPNSNVEKRCDEKQVKTAFNRFVRAGYMYSHLIEGERYYGLNLNGK